MFFKSVTNQTNPKKATVRNHVLTSTQTQIRKVYIATVTATASKSIKFNQYICHMVWDSK